MRTAYLLAVLLLILVACSSGDVPPPTATFAPIPPTAPPSISIEERLDEEATYEQLRQLHTQISAVWEGLSYGENVQCGDEFLILSPAQFARDDALGGHFRIAAQELAEAVQQWQAECDSSRQTVPPDVISEGVLKVRAAGDALAAAEALLSAGQ